MFGKIKNAKAKLNSYLRIRRLKKKGAVIHKHVFIDDKSSIGEKVIIRYGCRIYESEIGTGSSIASDNRLLKVKIGKFSSLGSNIHFVLGNHPINLISTSQHFYDDGAPNMFGFTRPLFEEKFKYVEDGYCIVIGNDVWVGEGVFIKGGVSIGDGAIIGMGAMVTKDVPPYAIVVGNPGRILRYRFDEDTRRKLLAEKWWEWPYGKISTKSKDFPGSLGLLQG